MAEFHAGFCNRVEIVQSTLIGHTNRYPQLENEMANYVFRFISVQFRGLVRTARWTVVRTRLEKKMCAVPENGPREA
jgi:hypothetical protein